MQETLDLKTQNLGKWKPTDNLREFPKELVAVMYDMDDSVLCGNRYMKGKVKYEYIPAEYSADGVPLFICWHVNYDGIGNANLPKGTNFIAFNELPNIFKHSTFEG